MRRWFYGDYRRLTRGEREFLVVSACWAAALALFTAGLFWLS